MPTAAEQRAAQASASGNGTPALDQHRLGIGADAEERRMAERELAGEAGEQHQAEADDGVDAA